MRINEYMKQYSVKIESLFGKQGSGTIIKVDDEQYYLATALHNFTRREGNESWRDVHVPDLKEKFNEIEVTRNNEVVCEIIAVKEDYRDLIIFEISNFDKLSDLAPTTILDDNFSSEINYFFHGYSVVAGAGVEPNLHTRDTLEDYIYTIQSDQSKRITDLRGYSGSGVFIEYRKKFYLVGIVLERNDSLSTFYIFNLPKKLKEWSRKKNPIPIVKDVFDVDSSPTMYTTMIRRNKDTFLSKKARRLFGANHKYKDLLDDTVKLKQLSKYIEDRNDLVELEEKYFKELADLYLLKTFIYNKQGKGKEARDYFEKAKLFRPDYIRYTNEVKEVDSKKELLDKGKLAYMNEAYSDAKDNFKKSLNLNNIEESEQIKIYQNLVEIGKYEKNNNEVVEAYYELLKLYPQEEKLKKAEIYYELSKLNEDENKQDLVIQGLNTIRYEYDSDFLEIKYKLLHSQDKILGEKDISLETKNILEKLVYTNPQYIDRLEEVKQRERERLIFQEKIQMQKDININEKEEVNTKIEFAKIISFLIIFILLVIVVILEKINIGIIIGTTLLIFIFYKFIKKNN